MHDYHAVRALIERVQADHPQDVSEVRIRAGVSYSPEALRQAYEMLTPGTTLEGSRLVVEPSSDVRVCAACGVSWHLSEEDLAGFLVVCPACGSPSPVEGLTGLEVLGVS